MVLELKPMGKLINFDNYLNVGQNKGLVWTTVPEEINYFKYLVE